MAHSSLGGRRKALSLALGSAMWGGFVMLITIECVWQLLDVIMASPHYFTIGSVGNEDGRMLSEGKDWWGINSLINLGVLALVIIIHVAALYCFWSMYIKPTPDKYIPVNAIVPDDLKGTWKYGIFECCTALGTCCCFSLCPACMTSDLWYRAGWLHAMMKGMTDTSREEKCPGWFFFAGVCGFCFVADLCCLPCLHAAGRGGLNFIDGSDGGMGDIVPMRKRFGMPHEGVSTFIEDCCCYCWCGPCIATQEYRQVMDLLHRGPVQVAAPTVAQVVGAPVIVQGAAVVQGAWPADSNK